MTKEAVKEFQRVYEKTFNERLTEKEATEKARRLLNLYKVVFQINKKGNYESRGEDN